MGKCPKIKNNITKTRSIEAKKNHYLKDETQKKSLY